MITDGELYRPKRQILDASTAIRFPSPTSLRIDRETKVATLAQRPLTSTGSSERGPERQGVLELVQYSVRDEVECTATKAT